jgi:hypothetical protein
MYHRSGADVKNICSSKALYYRRFLFHSHLGEKSVMQRTGNSEPAGEGPFLGAGEAEVLCS